VAEPIKAQKPEFGLDKQAVLHAISGCYGTRQDVLKKLSKIVNQLTKHTDNWPFQAKRLDKTGYSATHLKAYLRDILNLPGELALLRLNSGGFLLLGVDRENGKYPTLRETCLDMGVESNNLLNLGC